MKVQKRIVNVKRHVVGFVISRRRYTRGEAVKLARRQHVSGVAVRRMDREIVRLYITTLPYSRKPLYKLPEVVERGHVHQARHFAAGKAKKHVRYTRSYSYPY